MCTHMCVCVYLFIPSGTRNMSLMQKEWRGCNPNMSVSGLGEGVAVKQRVEDWWPTWQWWNQAEGQS